MFLEASELDAILHAEQVYINTLLKRWGTSELSEAAERALRMGKRTELIGDLQAEKNRNNARCEATK